MRAQPLPLSFLGLVLGIGVFGCASNDDNDDGTVLGTGGEGTGGQSAGGSSDGGNGPTDCEPGETMSCYTGAEGTEGVGACVAGTSTCLPDGSGFGSCEGQVTPVLESCLTPDVDDDCDGETDDEEAMCICVPGEEAPCYTGPIATQDVGLCMSGTRTCTDGTAFDACVGEVLPTNEVCESVGDENCDGIACSDPMWSKIAGDGSPQDGVAVAIDKAGNVFVAGTFEGTVNLGGSTLISDGGEDFYIAKYAPDGSHLWSKAMGAAGEQRVVDIAVDNNEDIAITGSFTGFFSLGGTILVSTTEEDGFVAKLSGADGSHIWSTRFGSGDAQLPKAIGVDVGGNVIVAGDIRQPAGCTTTCTFDIFVRKHIATGAFFTQTTNGNSNTQQIEDIAVDPAGSVWATGSFIGALDLGGPQLVSAGGRDAFLIKLDAFLAQSEGFRFGGAQTDIGLAVAIDSNGGPTLAGSYTGNITLGGSMLSNSGGTDFFLGHFNAAGVHLWSTTIGNGSNQSVIHMVQDDDDNIVLAGELGGSIDFGKGPLSSNGQFDLFLAKYSGTGFLEWARSEGGTLNERVAGVAVGGPVNAIAVAGQAFGITNFGGSNLNTQGQGDGFVATFQP